MTFAKLIYRLQNTRSICQLFGAAAEDFQYNLINRLTER